MNKKLFGKLVATSFVGLVAASAQAAKEAAKADSHICIDTTKANDSCAGKGGCGAFGSTCAGQNKCKGHGAAKITAANEADCTAKHGKWADMSKMAPAAKPAAKNKKG